MTNDGRLVWRDLGSGSDPVRVIFWGGGAGIEVEEEPESDSESDSDSDSGCGLC